MVQTAEELDLAARQVSYEVARLIEPRAGLPRERVGHEPLGRQPAAVKVAAGQPVSSDVELARHALRHRLQPRAQHVESGVGDRATDGRPRPSRQPRQPLGARQRPDAAADYRLGRAILVDEGGRGQQPSLPFRQQRRAQLLAADHDDVRGLTRPIRACGQRRPLDVLEGFEVCRRQLKEQRLLRSEEPRGQEGHQRVVVRQQFDAKPGQQRRE